MCRAKKKQGRGAGGTQRAAGTATACVSSPCCGLGKNKKKNGAGWKSGRRLRILSRKTRLGAYSRERNMEPISRRRLLGAGAAGFTLGSAFFAGIVEVCSNELC
jgi:hypothetical protein